MSRRFDAADLCIPSSDVPSVDSVGSPFPLDRPPSLTDAAAIRAGDWQAFQALSLLENHWSRKVWTPDYAAYYWYLTFEDAALVALAERCQALLEAADLDRVPPMDCTSHSSE